MEYKEFCGYRYSRDVEEEVAILKYESKSKIPYCKCSKCGKDIKRTMYVVQSKKTDVEIFYLGSECYKNLK